MQELQNSTQTLSLNAKFKNVTFPPTPYTDKTHLGLLDQGLAVSAHGIQHPICCSSPAWALALCCHQQRVHEGLGVAPSNADQQAVDEATDLCMRVCAFRGGG